MVEPPRTPQPGELIAGRYVLEEELGSGGMGSVHAARHTTTGRRFAIKLLKPQLAGDAEAEARFLREATLASAINHPAIIEVYDVGRHAGAPYMVMKLLQGESLGQRLKRGALGAEEAIAVMLPVLDGVAAAHERGIVHRDLKPDNILLQREGDAVQPKVLDFGISKLLSPDARTRLTKSGVSLGTPLYMSPEQVRGEDDVDHRADVYALGVIMYEMLTGSLPFHGNNYPDLVLKIVMGGAPRVRERNRQVPAALDAVVMRAMATARADRYANVRELATDLQRLRSGALAAIDARISQEPATSRDGTPFGVEAERPTIAARPRPSKTLYAVLAASALLALGIGAWLARGREGRADVPAVAAQPATAAMPARAAAQPSQPSLPEPPPQPAVNVAPAAPVAAVVPVAPSAASTVAPTSRTPAASGAHAEIAAGTSPSSAASRPKPTSEDTKPQGPSARAAAAQATRAPLTRQEADAHARPHEPQLIVRPRDEQPSPDDTHAPSAPRHRTRVPNEIIDPFESH